MNRLLLEIGTEEIPAGYINPALSLLSTLLLKKLDEARIVHAQAHTYGTPRRLAIIVDQVADRQLSLSTEVLGPPENIGFDGNGQPTVAAKKFAEKNAIFIDQVKIKETGKGRYLYAVKTEPGVTTLKILEKILPDVILSIPFPKSMRWSDLRFQFARPIHSICALLGGKVVSFELANIKSGRHTFGHRFLKPGKIKLSQSDQYLESLSSAYVLADINQRKEKLRLQMAKAVATVAGQILPDDDLMDIVANLVEFPVPAVGKFDEKFLEIPAEILITAMREHQKYFAVVDSNKKLMPYFIAINNTIARDMSLVASGHERVLRARLTDAQFFYQTDSRIPLDEMSGKLRSVMFQADLGSVYDKTLRIEKLAARLSELLKLEGGVRSRVSRAALLCKADLVSHVVGEFPKLQGIMGRVYALNADEPPQVAAAIEEHYRPTYSGASLPETIEGAVVSVADKIDSICGFFSVGLLPTGASDPHALRRQGIGVLQISLDQKFIFPLKEIIAFSASMFAGKESLIDDVMDFLKGRMSYLLEEEGVSKDVIASILSVPVDNVIDVWKRAHAMQQLKSEPDFDILAIAFKRVMNIIKKSDPEDIGLHQLDESFFEHPSESALYEQYKLVNTFVLDSLRKGDVSRSFKEITKLRPFVDRFFDDVMVMADNLMLRKNRLALLGLISDMFEKLADFSKIST